MILRASSFAWAQPGELDSFGETIGNGGVPAEPPGLCMPWALFWVLVVITFLLVVGLVVALLYVWKENGELSESLEAYKQQRKVRVKSTGREGVIVKWDSSDKPYNVRLDDGTDDWLQADQVEFLKAGEGAEDDTKNDAFLLAGIKDVKTGMSGMISKIPPIPATGIGDMLGGKVKQQDVKTPPMDETPRGSKKELKKLKITIGNATGLRRQNVTGNNLFCRVEVAGKTWQTSKVKHTLQPTWDETTEMEWKSDAEKVTITILNEGLISDKTEGTVEVTLEQFSAINFKGELPIPGSNNGILAVKIEPIYEELAAPAPAPRPSLLSAMTGSFAGTATIPEKKEDDAASEDGEKDGSPGEVGSAPLRPSLYEKIAGTFHQPATPETTSAVPEFGGSDSPRSTMSPGKAS